MANGTGGCILRGTCHNGYTQGECLAAGGEFVPGGCGTGGGGEGGSICPAIMVLVQAMNKGILALEPGKRIAYDFRDQVLQKSPVGQRLAGLYYKHVQHIFSAMGKDYGIVGRCIEEWSALQPFIVALIKISRNQGSPSEAKLRFTPARYAKMAELIGRFRGATTNATFRKALDEVKAEIKGYVNRTPAQVLKLMQRTSR